MSDRFGEQLRQWRNLAGLTQEKAGELFGITQQSLVNWESRGMRRPTSARLREIDRVYGLKAGVAEATFRATLSLEDGNEETESVGPDEFAELRATVEALEGEVADLKKRLKDNPRRAEPAQRRSK